MEPMDNFMNIYVFSVCSLKETMSGIFWIDPEWEGRTKIVLNKLTRRIVKANEEARSWKEECRKANMKLGDTEKMILEDTTTEL
jgi:hypothetical protein